MTLRVGTEQKVLYPHEDLLRDASFPLQSPIARTIQRAHDASIELAEDGVRGIEDFLKCTSIRESVHPDRYLVMENRSSDREYRSSVKLYGFAEKINCTRLEAATMWGLSPDQSQANPLPLVESTSPQYSNSLLTVSSRPQTRHLVPEGNLQERLRPNRGQTHRRPNPLDLHEPV
jgi:hypothetical protein